MLHDAYPPIAASRAADANAIAVDAALYHILANNSVDLIVRGDASGNRTFVSPSCQEILGYAANDLLGGHAYELIHPDDSHRVAGIFESLAPERPCLDLTFRMRRCDGTYIWIEARYRYIREDGGRLAILRDITAQKTAEEKLVQALLKLQAANLILERISHEDGLTGLGNRRYFDTMFSAECGRAYRERQPISLIMLDVDYFKAFNDYYGHPAGDDCLIKLSQAIMGALRRPGDTVYRYGGEEVVALLSNTDLSGATLIAEKVRHAVLDLSILHCGSRFGIVTVSAGVTSFDRFDAPICPSDLLEAADRALYRAKEQGRNQLACGMVEEAETLLST